MSTTALIVGQAPCALWGLDGRARLRRQLAQVGIERVVDDAASVADAAVVLVVDAAFLFDLLSLRGVLAQAPGVALVDPASGRTAAALVAGSAVTVTRAPAGAAIPPGLRAIGPDALAGYDRNLRKAAPPVLEHVTVERRAALENLLYGNAYKGITDLVTAWWWPRPARVLVAWCARLRISPNGVTTCGFVLVAVAAFAFLFGSYAVGLVGGWIMTLLDTVDGKLARVTVSSSRLGHVLDHGLDLVHPPFWYAAWGIGLVGDELVAEPIATWCGIVFAGYAAGRLIEAAFHALARCGLFAWRPFDAWFRLVTARRNPCLIILTVGTALGRADLAFIGVVAWTLASSGIMAVRLLQAAWARWRGGVPLDSWLADPAAASRFPLSFRTFASTRGADR